MSIRKYWLLISLGIIVLINFGSLLLSPSSPKTNLENRQLVTSLKSPKSFRSLPMWFAEYLTPYLRDTFLFREAAIKIHRRVKNLIRDEPNYEVWTGSDGWLFLGSPLVSGRTGSNGDPYSDMLGYQSNHHAEVEFFRVRKLAEICTLSNAKLIVMYPPNKETIYSNHLLTKISSETSALDRLEAKLSTLPITVIPVKRMLLTAKSSNNIRNLYYTKDSHWNFYGASLIFLCLVDKISTSSDCILRKPVFTIRRTGDRVSDLAFMTRSYVTEPDFSLEFHQSHTHQIVVDHYGKVANCNTATVTRPKVLVFRDSFFWALEPFFMHTDVDMITQYSHWTLEEMAQRITAEKPDVVVFEKVERHIGS